MGFLERMLGGFAMGHHGRRSGGHHGGGYYDNRPDPVPASRPTAFLACAKCGAQNREGASFCEQCGTSMTAAACAGCNAALPAGVKFCARCGRAV